MKNQCAQCSGNHDNNMNHHPVYFIILNLILAAVMTHAATAQEQQEWIGDRSDGSRAMPVHNIPLLDEMGVELSPDDEFPVPFSVKQTCGKCHQYERITQGWHFNAAIESATPGRPGHPWIYVDQNTGTVIPLSYRDWPGAFAPIDVGLNDWQFIKRFGRHWPGGDVGEWKTLDEQDLVMRKFVSGPLDANCLACHDADPAHDQAEYANQIARENFRWAAASTSSFAVVSGAASDMPDAYDYLMPEPPNDPQLVEPGIEYKPGIFDAKKRVFFDVKKRVPNERCYYCHTSVDLDAPPASGYNREGDVHIAAGMSCVDCHTNGVDHDIVRGYSGESQVSYNPMADVLTCEGCHIQHNNASAPMVGRFTAPMAEHKGIPPIHFAKLSCTACHSGPWPDKQAHRFKTSLAHGLGMHKSNLDPDALPHIFAPVFAKGFDGKIAPHYAIGSSSSATSTVQKIPPKAATTQKPYLWPMAHDVRPAAQSLGVRSCEDCHNEKSLFFSGVLPLDGPYVGGANEEVNMISLMELDQPYARLFNQFFAMRPIYKYLISISTIAIALIALTFLVRLAQSIMEKADQILDDELED